MVSYDVIELESGHPYNVLPLYPQDKEEYLPRWIRTNHNLDKLLKNNRPTVIISPIRILTEEELEEYRAFFCKEAKRVQANCVYYPFPVIVREEK
jgi:hypothetical protein